MSQRNRPDVFTYTAYRGYLEDWFAWKKEEGPFSHRIFARRIGSSDPSVLSNIIKGHRRLSEARIPRFATVLELDEDETEFFTLLVKLGHAGPGEAHERAWAALMACRVRHQGPSMFADQMRFLSNYYFPAIRTLAECEGFRDDPEWIADQLDPKLDPAIVKEALVMLERMGWLVREGQDLVPSLPQVRTDEQLLHLGSYGYHRDNLRLASSAMDRLHQPDVMEQTGFYGFSIAVPEVRLAEVRHALWESMSQTANRVGAWTEPRTRVFQVSVQLFPVSRSLASSDG